MKPYEKNNGVRVIARRRTYTTIGINESVWRGQGGMRRP